MHNCLPNEVLSEQQQPQEMKRESYKSLWQQRICYNIHTATHGGEATGTHILKQMLTTYKHRSEGPLLHNCSDKATYTHECQHSPLNRKLVRVCIVTTSFAGTHTHAVHIPGLQGTQAEMTRVNAHSNTIQVSLFQRRGHSVCAVH